MHMRAILAAAFFGTALTAALPAHAVKNDEILSQHIKEADGASGQNTNAGAGVKTGHIQDSAITAAKIADGAVTPAKLAAPVYTKAEVNALLAGMQAQIAALQDLLQHVTRDGNDLFITGANLHIRSGSGSTFGAVNGLGNLVLGYNEARNDGSDNRTGSHNLVAGIGQNFSSYGGVVVGQYNEISGAYAVVSGGQRNVASGDASSVSGGDGNTAGGHTGSVSGGMGNLAAGKSASVSGGYSCIADGTIATVGGGYQSIASGFYSSVTGGFGNRANGYYSSVTGGAGSTAGGSASSISGGWYHQVYGEYDWQAGGLFQDQ